MFPSVNPQMSPPEFWFRFSMVQDKIRDALHRENSPEAFSIFAELLAKYDKSLACQIGVSSLDGMTEIQISADGHLGLFQKVIDLTKDAPEFPGFRVQAFKQRLDILPGVQLPDGIVVTSDQLRYACVFRQEKTDIEIWFDLPPDIPKKVLSHLAFIFLDCTLGEYDVAVFIGSVDVHHGRSEKAKPWSTLRDNFDQWLEKTHPRQ